MTATDRLPDPSLWDSFVEEAFPNIRREQALAVVATDKEAIARMAFDAGRRDYQDRITGRSTEPRHWNEFRSLDLWRVMSTDMQKLALVAVMAGGGAQHRSVTGEKEPEWWKALVPQSSP